VVLDPATRLIPFDPLAPGQRADPYPVLAQARREQPVFYAPALGLWVVTRHEDVLAVLKDHRAFSSVGALRSSSAELPPQAVDVLAGGCPEMPIIVDTDPPLHTRIRGLVTKAFTPRRVAEMEPRIEATAGALLDELVPEGRADIVERFAWPLPLRTIGDLLGVPRADLPRLHGWSRNWLTLFQDAPLDEQMAHAHGFVELQRYFVAALEERERQPTDDLMSALLEARGAGGGELGIVEVAGVPLDLIVAGHVTVTRAIGSALVLLLDHPDELAALRADPDRIPAAVEEILRLESPAQGLFRETTREVTLDGTTLPAGARVMVHFGSANRDEDVFTRAACFDPGRGDLGSHVAFGKGIHFCIGAPLARIELRVALRLLLERLPNLRRAGGVEYDPIFFARGLARLDVEWDPA